VIPRTLVPFTLSKLPIVDTDILIIGSGSAALRAETGASEISKQNVGLVEPSAFSDEEIETLIDQRSAARAAKNFAESDRIRDVLGAQGIVLEDRPDGQRTLWRRGR